MAQNSLSTSQLRIGGVVQARVRSSRLPGKALLPLPLGGEVTLFEQVLRRARRATTLSQVIVAVPDTPADDVLTTLAARQTTESLRGDEANVLSRFYAAAQQFDLDVIVRLTADNPALDPGYIDTAVRAHLDVGADYTITTGLPLGMNIEVLSRAALTSAYQLATTPTDREHVTSFIRHRPTEFRLLTLPLLTATPSAAALRLTVDYPTDYALLHLLYSTLGADFGVAELLSLINQHPWLAAINAENQQIQV